MNRIAKLKEKAALLPMTPGVYLMKDSAGVVIYVGKAKSLRRRVSSYFINSKNREEKMERMIRIIHDFEIRQVVNELEALLLECRLIHDLRPIRNRQMNKFERYKYINLYLTPNLKVKLEFNASGLAILGPFRSNRTAINVERILNEVYQLKNEGDWLQAIRFVSPKNIGIDCANKKKELLAFFNGDATYLIGRLKDNMYHAADALQFELAKRYLEDQALIEQFLKSYEQLQSFRKVSNLYFLVEENGYKRYLLLKQGRVVQITNSPTEFKQIEACKEETFLSKAELDEMMIVIQYLKQHPNIELQKMK